MILEQYTILSNFTSGICLGTFLTAAFYVYRSSETLYRFQKIFIALLAVMGLTFFDTLWTSIFPNISFKIEFVNNLVLTLESWVNGFWLIFLIAVIYPEISSWKTSLILMAPFVAFTTVYSIVGTMYSFYGMIVIVIIFDIIITYLCFREVGRKNKLLKEEESNIENRDLTWCYPILIVIPTFIIVWVLYSITQSKLPGDTVSLSVISVVEFFYCATWILFCLYIAPIVSRQKPVLTSKEENVTKEIKTETEVYNYHNKPVLDNIEKIIMDKGYFLDYDINLNTLALKLGTNRQYLSNYINKEKHQSFYDYINSFRIERAKQLLADKTYTLSIEEIALESGFKAYSSFIRIFGKVCKQTPSAYRKQA